MPKSLKIQRTVPPSSSSTSSSSSSSPSYQSTAKSESISLNDQHNSARTSPSSLPTSIANALTNLKQKEASTSVPTSPESLSQEKVQRRLRRPQQNSANVRKCDVSGFRTSRSEDHLQHSQCDALGAIVPIDVDEDVNSSLNTLLDTRADSEGSQGSSDRDRIVWTYNAPVIPPTTTTSSSYNYSQSFSSSMSSSPQHSADSPASPTSVSSSIMSSSGSKENQPIVEVQHNLRVNNATDLSMSEAVSNISSPDYQDDDNLLSTRDIVGMGISDPSDSDSTILVSDIGHRQTRANTHDAKGEHKIVIKVKGVCNQLNLNANAYPDGANNLAIASGYSELRDSEDELATITEDVAMLAIGQDRRDSSPPVSDDGSDVDSLHSYHYSPKAVDIPSAVRLAKRLFGLEGFKKSDVSRHLSKKYV